MCKHTEPDHRNRAGTLLIAHDPAWRHQTNRTGDRERLVPFMALLYIVLALGVIVLNIGHSSGGLCFHCSRERSHPAAVTGGVSGQLLY